MLQLVLVQAAGRKSNLLHFLPKSSQPAVGLRLTVSGKTHLLDSWVFNILCLCVKSGQHFLSFRSHLSVIKEGNK